MNADQIKNKKYLQKSCFRLCNRRESAANNSELRLDANQVARIVDREDADKSVIAEIKSSQAAIRSRYPDWF